MEDEDGYCEGGQLIYWYSGSVVYVVLVVFVFYINGYGVVVFCDSQRLVFVLFFIFLVLWVVIDFVMMFIDIIGLLMLC